MTKSSKRRRPNTSRGGVSKRSRPPPPLTVGSGEVMFRLVCPVSLAGGLIGKSGAVVNKLQDATSSKIRVEDAPPGASDGRAVIIVGPKNVTGRIDLARDTSLEREGGDEVRGEEESVEVSPAQEAVVRVFERMVEVMKEDNKEKVVGLVTCWMLAETSQVGGVIGKGGKVVDNIRRESRCKIRVSNVGKDLPVCAFPNEQLMEMEGDLLAVKRALIAITGRLQECPPLETTKVSENRPYQTTPYTNFLNSHPHDRMSILPSSSYPYPPRGRYSTEIDPRTKKEEVVFRILCSRDRIGGVIGKGGNIVNALQNETGAAITAGGSIPDCDERLITITAKEDPESRFSPAQNAIVLVFNRSIEAGYEKGLHSVGNKIVSARIAVPVQQIGCLIGNGGAIITEMRMRSGVNIGIIGLDKLPRCVAENDEVLEITGEFVNVQEALLNVTSLLRRHIFSYNNPNGHTTRTNSVTTDMNLYERARNPTFRVQTSFGISPNVTPNSEFSHNTQNTEMNLYERARNPTFGVQPSFGISQDVTPNSEFSHNMQNTRHPHIYDHPPASFPWATQAVGGVNPRRIIDLGSGPASVKGGIELGSGSRSAIVTNSTVDIVIPNNVIGSVYGENGSNLARLRQISGAKVAVHEPRPGTADWTIVISGTPDETQAAQSLVQAFILTGQS